MRPKWLSRIWRLGDIQLPIGSPWFQMQRRWWGRAPFFFVLMPIRWQGWALLAALFGWLGLSAAAAVFLGLEPSDAWLYFWLMPTLIFWCIVIGIKTDNFSVWTKP